MSGQVESAFKLYPSCSVTLALTDGVLQINNTANIDPQDIELEISPATEMICGDDLNLENPQVGDALFSVEYVAASVLLRNQASLTVFATEAVADPAQYSAAFRCCVRPLGATAGFVQHSQTTQKFIANNTANS